MRLAFIIDPIEQLDPTHDTSVALMEAAVLRGDQVFLVPMASLGLEGGRVWGWTVPVQILPVELVNGKWLAPQPWYHLGEGIYQPLATMQAVWMRVDPPVTTEYLYATYLLDYLDCLVLNSPQGIRTANEKLYAMQFSSVIPQTIVTASKQRIRQFVKDLGKVVLKPLGGKGGEGILLLTEADPNLNSLIELSTNLGKTPVMVQAYLEKIIEGDKRIIILNGEPIGGVNRIPAQGELRGNMAAGGSVAKTDLTERDQEICQLLADTLKQDGLYFVGIDVIGGYLTEVNVTSPTGIREIDRLQGTKLGEQVIAWLADQVS
ncbi:MAG: glutathione synthase [Pseudanabaenaceae cyanobacterium]